MIGSLDATRTLACSRPGLRRCARAVVVAGIAALVPGCATEPLMLAHERGSLGADHQASGHACTPSNAAPAITGPMSNAPSSGPRHAAPTRTLAPSAEARQDLAPQPVKSVEVLPFEPVSHDALASATAPYAEQPLRGRTPAPVRDTASVSGAQTSANDSAVIRTANLADARSGVMSAAVPPLAPYPIDLPTALRLAASINPVINAARARVGEALGRQQQSQALLLPTLNAGISYFGHTGQLQRSDGQILNVSNQALYFGGGAEAVAQNTITVPAVNIAAHLTDALFEPLAARQLLNAARFDAAATANSVLLDLANDYIELHGAMAQLHARRRTESEAAEVARVTAGYARTGEGRQADADRARTEWKMRRAEIRAAEERWSVASARLVRRLHIQDSVHVEPAGNPLELYTLVAPEAPLEDLLRTAVQQRPEIRARAADLAAAETRVRQERYRPFLPMLWLGFSGGAFGGGSNLVPPTMGDFRGRTDFDVIAYWTLRNFGYGNLKLQQARKAEAQAAASQRARVLNRVRDEVASARADVLEAQARITVALGELTTATEGFARDLERIRGAAGRPLEVLDNLRLLRGAREQLIDAVVDYNQAQFRLFVSLGSPPPLETPREAGPPSAAAAALAETPFAPAPHSVVAGAAPRSAIRGLEAGAGALARAHAETVRAASAYEQAQARLTETVAAGAEPVDAGILLERLRDLAGAHRDELKAHAAYDHALVEMIGQAAERQDAATPEARLGSAASTPTPR